MAYVPATNLTAFASSGINGLIMHIWYDNQYDGFGYTQENLRKRVSAKSYQDGSSTPQMTYYSYDQIGMVKTLWQQIDGLGTKQIEYNYDLVSGKVNKLRYQHFDDNNAKTDQFYYGYEYDADNRVIKSLTGIKSVSSDGWEIENPKTDVLYNYYLHGPLSRMELGNKQLVQGVDYAYTLQGWVKGVNSQYLNTENDMGKDGLAGNVHSVVAPGVFGYSLDYYTGDYTSIGNQQFMPLGWQSSASTAAGHNLYNGNISRMTVASAQFGNTVGYSYRYDQLNRMKAMHQHPLTAGATSWNASTAGTAYQEDVTYDGNGNILSYDRNGSGANGKNVGMDKLTYGYIRDASGYLLNNRLSQVTDAITTHDYGTADLKSQSDNNYSYDKMGNMVSDLEGGLANVTWTAYGKIRTITKADGSTIEYKYDADGNRIYKSYTNDSQVDKTWYVRDATGNVLAIYGNKNGDANIYWEEQQLYGSGRLGAWYPDLSMSANASSTVALWGATNKKQYELSNHLGNVVATVSDELKSDNTALVLNANDYYPFGMIQPDRSYSSRGYRYGFNGQEKSDEIKDGGNSYTAEFWEYDPRLGRRWNLDPNPRVGWSQYAVLNDAPLLYSDIKGDTVWPIYNKWDDGFITKYKNHLKDYIQKYESEEKKFTCDDLALYSILEFSKDNGLPFKWITGAKKFDAAKDEAYNFDIYANDVLRTSGAPDFQTKGNTLSINKEDMEAGGISLLSHREGKKAGIAHHVQLTISVYLPFNNEGILLKNASWEIKQGNFRKEWWIGRGLTGSSNPTLFNYLGVKIQTGRYYLYSDFYHNQTTNSKIFHFSQDKDDKVSYKIYDFSNWNK
ncbi:hypothetical protein SIO70_02125 [Chitinophaga sancti]|uniref:RHS repeat domain-containing protein n=1 Tax=Chitinophaga sancti TaxID=1004 RepID=UPI002A76648C|nr:hypothetical protein [Chitinophaga sancti]WPQ63658.1 hypothetical protein SIO70_02125 [Chitinophaga sancti]